MKRWRKPEYKGEFPTLGWEVLEWTHTYLPSPADESGPLVLTDEQAQRVLRWFMLDPISGEFVYETLVLEEAKGSGKSPFAAVLALVEFAGPCLFDGWDAEGNPVAVPWGTGERPSPHSQIAAVSEDQTENTYGALYSMLMANDAKAADALGIDAGRTRLYLTGRPGRLEPVTASAGSREGQRVTDATKDETHLWTPRNGGVRLAKTINRNVAKMGGRSKETTNAPVLGENSVAEQRDPDNPDGRTLHYAHRPSNEPEPDWSDAQMREALAEVYGDAWWVDYERRIREIRDPAAAWSDSLQFWFNIRSPGANRAVDPRRWADLIAAQDVENGSDIGLGFEGVANAVVLRACTRTGYGFTLGAWVAPQGDLDWQPPREAVNEAVAGAFATYRVGRFLVNPANWRTEAEAWATSFGDKIVLAVERNQPTRMSRAVDRWLTSLRTKSHPHDGDEVVAAHVAASYLRKVLATDTEEEGRTMYVLERGGGSLPITGAVADVLALEACETSEWVAEKAFGMAWTS